MNKKLSIVIIFVFLAFITFTVLYFEAILHFFISIAGELFIYGFGIKTLVCEEEFGGAQRQLCYQEALRDVSSDGCYTITNDTHSSVNDHCFLQAVKIEQNRISKLFVNNAELENLCKNVVDKKNKIHCNALLKNEVTLCQGIDACYFDLALINNDKSICYNMTSRDRQVCIFYVIFEQYSYQRGACTHFNASENWAHDHCWFSFANYKQDGMYCNAIKDSTTRTSCLQVSRARAPLE